MNRSTVLSRWPRALAAATILGAGPVAAGPATAAPCCGGLAPPDLPVLVVHGDTQVYEADGQAWISITRNQTGSPFEVVAAIEHGDTSVSDIEVDATWKFPAGASKIERAITITQGDEIEGPETFTLRIRPEPGQGFTSADPEVDITILDGNGPQMEVVDAVAPEGDAPGGGHIPVVVKASYAPLQDLTFRLHSGVFGSEAQPGVDFTPIDELVTLPAGADSVEVALPVIGDDLDEDDELLPVYASDPSHGDFPVGDGSAEMRILDDDLPGEDLPPAGGGASGGAGNGAGAPSFSPSDPAETAAASEPDDRRPVRQELEERLGRTAATAATSAGGPGLPLMPLALVGGWALLLALWVLFRRADRRSGDDGREYRSVPTAAD